MERLSNKWSVNLNASGWQTGRIWAMLVLIGICLGMLLFSTAYSQDDMGGMDMGGMDPGMGGMDPGMGGMDPGMGGMDPGMGGMDPGMGGMDPGMGPGMPDSAGLPLDPGPVMPDVGNMPGDTGMPPPTPDRPDGMDGPNPVPPPQPNPVIDPYWLNGGWGMGYGLGYGYGGYGGLGYGTYGRTYPMSIVPRHGTLSQAQVHHGHVVMVPHFYSHTTKKLYPMVSHETLKSEETTKAETSKTTDNTKAMNTKTVDNTKTNISKAASKPTSKIPPPESDHVAVPVVPYKVGSQTHAMPVFHPAPVPQMRINPAPYSPVPMFDTYPGTGYRSGGALGPNYHTPIYRDSPTWGLSMPMGGGGFLTMPVR